MTKKKLMAAAATALAMMLATSAPAMAQEVDFDGIDFDGIDGGDVYIVVVDDFDRNDRQDNRQDRREDRRDDRNDNKNARR